MNIWDDLLLTTGTCIGLFFFGLGVFDLATKTGTFLAFILPLIFSLIGLVIAVVFGYCLRKETP